MKKGNQYRGIVSKYLFPNKGIIHCRDVQELEFPEGLKQNNGNQLTEEWKNRSIVVKNAFEGQTIRFQITKVRKGQLEGRVIEVIESSPFENAKPFCPSFHECGGCQYQTFEYQTQLQWKERQIKDMFEKEKDTFLFESILKSPVIYGYRNKMEFTFGDREKGGELTLGQHKKGSFYDIINVPHCKIASEEFGVILDLVLQISKQYQLSYFHKMRHEGYLRHLLIRRSETYNQYLICLETTD